MLNDAEFALVAREVKARSGAVLTRAMGAAITIRLQPLVRRENFTSVSELIAAARIRPDGALWRGVSDALVQSETRFFRDRRHFARLNSEIMPAALMRRGRERVRVWSAGCSSGQEPYSIAMLVDDFREAGLNPAVEIVATDVSERLLEKARAGLYTQFEVQRGLPIRKLIAHFEKVGDLWRISDRLRASVRFEAHNLMKHPRALGQFDIIMLARVLPSFDLETRLAVLSCMADALRPEGVLILGAGETLPEGCAELAQERGLLRRPSAVRRIA